VEYPHWLLVIFAVWWLVWAIRPADRRVWLAENSVAITLVLFLIAIYPYFRFSNLSYTLSVVLLFLHAVGGHYMYSKVPYDRWSKRLLGRTISELFGFKRNHYDRLVHFAFGILMAQPARELLQHYAQPREGWSEVLPVCVIMSLAMAFELIEAVIAAALGGGAGQEYLAAQGDEWDAHKDMALAALGAIIAMIIAGIA